MAGYRETRVRRLTFDRRLRNMDQRLDCEHHPGRREGTDYNAKDVRHRGGRGSSRPEGDFTNSSPLGRNGGLLQAIICEVKRSGVVRIDLRLKTINTLVMKV
jgi:hypothetical protein